HWRKTTPPLTLRRPQQMLSPTMPFAFLCAILSSNSPAVVEKSLTIMWSGEAVEYTSINSIYTAVNGPPSLARWALCQPVSMNLPFIELWLRLDSLQNWMAIEVRFSATPDFSTYGAIPMKRYTDTDFNWLQDGALRKVTLSLGEAAIPEGMDLSAIKYIGLY